jgi:hypothetical protein
MNHCPDCGASVDGGRDACQALFDEFRDRAYLDQAYARRQVLAFDAYCMQHLERYCRSAKSYMAHLARLCCGVENDGDQRIYDAINRSLDGTVAIEKPPVLSDVGGMTVADLRSAEGPDEYAELVERWARNVWDAYGSQHEIARAWIRSALE